MIKIAMALILTLAGQAVALAQSKSPEGLMGDLITDVTKVEAKVVALAKAIPESAYNWRPSDGVRSTSEVLRHVAADNYFAAANLGGVTAPDTGIVGKEYKEVTVYEERKLTRTQVIAALEQSFVLLKKAMANTSNENLEATSNYFGTRKVSVRAAWLAATTHLHEHLGQLIAYARSNKIVPPWSR